jgi:TalC/MipB family fructose-6-phosphate aldolase
VALYVDSASLPEVEAVCARYPIAGVTTNPSILLAAAKRGQRLSDGDVLQALLQICTGPVFMQPVGDDAQTLLAITRRYLAAAPERVVAKLPPTEAGVQAGRTLLREGTRVAFTAVCSLPQAYVAAQVGAQWVIPYFGRIRRAGEDPAGRVAAMARLLALQSPSPTVTTRVLAASLRTPRDVVEATLAGAHDVTVPPEVIGAFLRDSISEAALARFAADWAQLHATSAGETREAPTRE